MGTEERSATIEDLFGKESIAPKTRSQFKSIHNSERRQDLLDRLQKAKESVDLAIEQVSTNIPDSLLDSNDVFVRWSFDEGVETAISIVIKPKRPKNGDKGK